MATAQELYELVSALRESVEESWTDGKLSGKWSNDDQFAKSYAQLALEAAGTFSDDELIGGLQVSIPKEFAGLIKNDASCLTAWVRVQLARLTIRLSQLARQQGAGERVLIDLDLDFLVDDGLRFIVAADFTEAQRAYYAGAPKACAVLCGSAIEGMLLDTLITKELDNTGALDALPKKHKSQEVDWDKAALTALLKAARKTKAIRETTFRFAEGARDLRDTLHPRAEIRAGARATVGEASLLIEIVKLLAEDLLAGPHEEGGDA